MKPERYGVIEKVVRGLVENFGDSVRAGGGPKDIFKN